MTAATLDPAGAAAPAGLCLGAEVRLRKGGHSAIIIEEVPAGDTTYYRLAAITRFPAGDVIQHEREFWPLTAADLTVLA